VRINDGVRSAAHHHVDRRRRVVRIAPAATKNFGASSKSTLFVCTLEGRTLRLYRTGNGGTQWTVVAIAPDTVADGAVAPTRIVFPSDPAYGWWLPGYATAFSTTDAGRTWNPFMVG
jgi:hypothetical protein